MVEADESLLGRVVYSKAGRDSNRYFIICDVIDSSFVRVVDGDLRKVENPKKKNIKHLRLQPQKVEALAEKFRRGEPVTNAEVRKALESLNLTKNPGK